MSIEQNQDQEQNNSPHIEDIASGASMIGNTVQDATTNASKEVAKKVAQEATRAAVEESAAAATGPAGEAIKYAIKILRKLKDDAVEIANGGKEEKKEKHNKFLIFLAIVFLMVNVFSFDQGKTLITPTISKYSAGLFGEFSDEIFCTGEDVAVQQLRANGHVILAALAKAGLNIYKKLSQHQNKVVPFFENIYSKNENENEDDGEDQIGIASDIDMNQLFNSSTNADIEIIQKLGFKRAIDDAKEIAKAYILDQDDIDIDRSFSILDQITWESVYIDTNYAEFLSVLNENKKLSSNNGTLKKFKKLFNTKKKRKNLWRIRFDLEEVEEKEPIINLLGIHIGTRIKIIKYINTTIKPYTLEGLYKFSDVDADDYHYLYKNTKNRDVLNYSEKTLRLYTSYYDFGSTDRTLWEDDFEETDISSYLSMNFIDKIKYTAKALPSDVWSMVQDLLDGKDISEGQKAIVEAAFNTVGCAYSKDYRDDIGVYDCSSLVARVYAAAGYPIANYNPVAADECKIMESWGTALTDYSDLQPGDIIFFSYKDDNGNYNGRYKNISHVAIYVGNGMQIDARGKKYGVVYRESQANSKAVSSICRPLAYLSK